ncbi:Di-copper centre-containing protein [Xylaria sp. CBS 124048]|nr:Di-copper centre-containing protein [Xylaria sp. CBS 124048]
MGSIHALVSIFSLFLISHDFAAAHVPRGYDYGLNASHHIHKRDIALSSIVGSLPLVDGRPPQRREIRDLQKDDDQWNLFILAISWMQYTTQDSPFSWYQIAGIHGAPGLTWGGVAPLPGNDQIGYCHHVSILFPTWHRPYLALYEQTMYNIVQFIASLWPPEDLDRVQDAARNFRVPYWDWAVAPPAGESALPLTIGGSSTMAVSGPNGVQNISNPLFSFIFRPFNGSIFRDSPYNTWNETKRAPFPVTDPNAISNNSLVAASFDSHLPSYQQRLYNLFTNYPNYTHFSNEAWIGPYANATHDSLESLHDSVHTIGGGGWGHLAIIAYSAFDPLFFLHHANVDRIFAMWQVIHNETYVVPTATVYATHTQNQGEIEDIQTPLKPFFVNDTSFWTSDMIRNHETFGYTYPEVDGKNRDEVIAAINRLYTDYSPATLALKRNREANKGQSTEGMPRTSKVMASTHESSRDMAMDTIFTANSKGKFYHEWITNIVVNKHALNSSFLIYLFVGAVPDDTSSWQTHDNLVGSLGIFANNDQQMGRVADGKVSGTVPLTSALMRMVADGYVPSLSPDDVNPFLRSALQLRVALTNGTSINATGVDGLSVSIVSSEVTAPSTEYELPRWGKVVTQFDLAT